MNKELIINSGHKDVNIAILEEGKLVELHKQEDESDFQVGDVYLGRVSKLMPGLNAAFVDIGHSKEAFIHFTDLGPKLPSVLQFTKSAMTAKSSNSKLDGIDIANEINKRDKIGKVLKKRTPLLVQILKEPISTKGPRLTCEITLPGRFLVLIPFSNEISISKKIEDQEERKRLENLMMSIKPKNFGLIVRTAARSKTVAPLHEEITELLGKWDKIHKTIAQQEPPKRVLCEEDKTKTILRDLITKDYSKIVVNDKGLESSIKDYLKDNIPELHNTVHLHRSQKPVFQETGITRQIKTSFGKSFTMDSGAYLVIEHTEAMHVIDVNSGPKMSQANRDDAALKVNLEAAKEVARQLRLRDLGGLIIIDFIDMKKSEQRNQLFEEMKNYMKRDRAQHTILPLSKFGLMQITRQRVKPEVVINTKERCPTCNGTGKIDSSFNLMNDIERDLTYSVKSSPKIQLTLVVHPYISAYLRRGIKSIQRKWYIKFKKWITIHDDASLSLVEYKLLDGSKEEIRL